MKIYFISFYLLVIVNDCFPSERCNAHELFSTISNLEARYSIFDFSKRQIDKLFIQQKEFYSKVDYSESKIKASFSFSGSKFHSTVNFKKSMLYLKVDFSKCTFDSIADFRGVKLPDTLNLLSVNFSKSGFIDLQYCESDSPKKTCFIILENTDLKKIDFDYSYFTLSFRKNIDLNKKEQLYIYLIDRQKELGYERGKEKADKEYRQYIYLEKNASYWNSFINFMQKKWYDYGYRKEFIIVNTLLIFLIFCFINYFILNHLVCSIYELEKLKSLESIEKTGFKKFFVRTNATIIFTALIFFGVKFDIDKLKYRENLGFPKFFYLIYFFVIYISGLVCLAYLINFIISR